MTVTFIENDALRVAVAVHYGARVVSLLDKTSGREWMTQGGESRNTGEDVDYRDKEAVGWDECFPTVGVWDATATPYQRRMRDHGDIWGRPWQVDASGIERLATTHTNREFRFTRDAHLAGSSLVVDYAVTNISSDTLPYLWALHALLAVGAGDRIEIVGTDTVRAAFAMLDGKRLPEGNYPWTAKSDALAFPLSDVQPPSSQFMGKFVAGELNGKAARVGRPGQWLEIAWDETIADLGIWFTYGAWFGHQEIALEPQSGPGDHLGQTIGAGAPSLAPGQSRRWQVKLTVSA